MGFPVNNVFAALSVRLFFSLLEKLRNLLKNQRTFSV